jgi:N-acyl-D-aspartate/D-glutamate deacylase
MAYDLVITNGMVIDGTGFPRYRADLGIRHGRIADIGHLHGAAATRTIDADGLCVAPGIIDLHTHYDAQPFWDKLCTPSIWHGVTTVLAGNCGLTLAPLRPEHREAMLATFCCVEDLPLQALGGVLPWNWQTLGEFMDAIDQGLGVNMMPLVGHNPLRLSAMGEAAWERAATPEEMATMQTLLQAAMQDGAWGWSTTASPTHAGPTGDPVPTRLADDAERLALARTMGTLHRGVIEVLPRTIAQLDTADQQHVFELAVASGRPLFLLGFSDNMRPYIEASAQAGAQLCTLLRVIPFNRRFTLKRTTFFRNLDLWDTVLGLPLAERLAAFANPQQRAALRDAAMQPQRRRPGVPGRPLPWHAIAIHKVTRDMHRAMEGRRLVNLAEAQGTHVVDVMLDLAVSEGLETEFQVTMRPAEEEVRLAELVKSGHAIPSQTDAGAHLNTNFCTAGESTYVLSQWVRERQFLSLEDAVRRLTFQPARLMGLRDRGLIREGLAADLMLFDLARIGVTEDEVWNDGPAGTPRRVQGAEGIHAVIVNGQVVLHQGQHTGALPGRVLRSSAV